MRDLKKHFPIKGGILGRTQAMVQAVDGVSFDVRAGKPWASSANPAAESPPRRNC
ncbi:hypothetical protein FLP41_09335 [Paracoccus marcusii]|nr:hypothetical protein FLP41_09335 [Paracoccus marcusii]